MGIIIFLPMILPVFPNVEWKFNLFYCKTYLTLYWLIWLPSSAEDKEILGILVGTKNEILFPAGLCFSPSFKSICWSRMAVTSARLWLTKSSPIMLNSSLSLRDSTSSSSSLGVFTSIGWLIASGKGLKIFRQIK